MSCCCKTADIEELACRLLESHCFDTCDQTHCKITIVIARFSLEKIKYVGKSIYTLVLKTSSSL